ncbi:class E sortase [Streptomyces sp. NRRL B-24085]|uniref:class E sortase n=2 Tax=Streptomyces sp. NRRL B-24085 TaxID=1709476 RepID=UPI000A3C75DB|nr:class E sortase [Streptomyces sp. NRRL B-24085]
MRQRITHHGSRRRRERRRRAVRAGGELLVTVGCVLLLLVVHQLWWTNREARDGAQRKVEALEREWGRGQGADPGSPSAPREPGEAQEPHEQQSPESSAGQDPHLTTPAPDPSQAYAVFRIPRLHLRVPVAEGVGRRSVLNKGYVGHYPGTGQPGGAGNFALAGHRNSHGEPFRYVDRLVPGDTVRVETRSAVYTYAVDRTLRQTSARDSGVIARVPRSSVRPAFGYTAPGHYLTLTTCTPEYTSRYRLVVWGKLVSARPR